MLGLSIWHLLVIGVVVCLLFGGRIADLMKAAGMSIRTGEGPASRFVPPVIPKIIKLLIPASKVICRHTRPMVACVKFG